MKSNSVYLKVLQQFDERDTDEKHVIYLTFPSIYQTKPKLFITFSIITIQEGNGSKFIQMLNRTI